MTRESEALIQELRRRRDDRLAMDDEQERASNGQFGTGSGKVTHKEQSNGRVDVSHVKHGPIGSVSRLPNTKKSWQAYSKKSGDMLRNKPANLNAKEALVGRTNTGKLRSFPSKEHAISALHEHHEGGT